MKRLVTGLFLLTTIFLLVACGSSASESGSSGASSPQAGAGAPGAASAALGADPTLAELSGVQQLLVGTFKLEGTDVAVTEEQAAQLLPLWKGYRALSAADTVSQPELQALIAQLEKVYTAAQQAQWAELKFTRADMSTLMQEKGLSEAGAIRSAGNTSSGSSSSSAAGGFGGGPGGPGGGGPPDMMMAPMGVAAPGVAMTSGTPDVTKIATLRAQAANRVPAGLLDVLLALLQERAGV